MRAPRLRLPRLFALTPESPPCPLRPRYVRELFRLARLGKAAELRAILEKLGRGNPLLQTRDYSGRSLVLTAAREGSVAVVRALLEANPNPKPNPNPDPNPEPNPNPNPHPHPHPHQVLALLEFGCDPCTPNDQGWTPLAFAARGAPKKEVPPG